ncbi:glycosyltransferase [Jannaschia sp. S6380]|uniref:glycosyltransferase n=1 Tax=Jannaschia sp. S6380 TaxID=2926408 RepID=UPI001FF657CC|nr:glycosyltransferase [Jannaschia sp. S6380]MCK0167074.1 glycosyltransferase [Jannaschia sp. S6380]
MDEHQRTPPLQWSGVSRLPGLEGRIPDRARRAIVLTTLGSLGDLYPVLSIARALTDRGIEVRLALSPEDCDMARRWGLLATPIGPSQAEICDRLGLTRDEIAAAVLRDPTPLLRNVAIPMLPELVPEMEEVCRGTACVAATSFALFAPLAAERLGLPFVPLVLQPMLMFSPLDPPRGRGVGLSVPQPRTGAARLWNRGVMGAARGILRLAHKRPLSRVRAGLDLLPQPGTPLLDHGARVPLRLGLWSPRFAPLPADRRDEWRAVGFPPAPEGELTPEAQSWLDAGPPPLIITLGSIAQSLGGSEFWPEAVKLARALGVRAVLLHGKAEVPSGPDILALPYAAHAPLFPQAAAILHHGGIGTSAEALRAARPQMVVPVGGDQPDNAARLERLGVAVTLPVRRFAADRAIAPLRALLDRFDYAAAGELGRAIAEEDGARQAAFLLANVVDGVR